MEQALLGLGDIKFEINLANTESQNLIKIKLAGILSTFVSADLHTEVWMTSHIITK